MYSFHKHLVRALLLWVVIVGEGEGADVTVTTLPECRQHHIIFLHKRRNLLNHCALKAGNYFISDIEQNLTD